MNIGLVVVSYNKPDLTEACIDSAVSAGLEEGDNLTIYLFNHYHPACDYLEDMATYYPEVRLHNYGVNRGLARSWNDGIAEAKLVSAIFNEDIDDPRPVLVANADIEFRAGSISQMARSIVEQDESAVVVWCNGEHGDYGKNSSMGYSLFGVTSLGIRTIGYFDQNFFPAYGEDCDYDRRIKLSGLSPGHCDFGGRDDAVYHVGSAHIRHARGSDAQRIIEQSLRCQELNNAYFKRKWGLDIAKHSTPQEGYQTPFNDPFTEIRIAFKDKDHPYGVFDRTDQEVVTV